MAPHLDVSTARRNSILDALPDAELTELLPVLTDQALLLGDVLYEPGKPIEVVHFPLTGVVSLLTELSGKTSPAPEVIETATVGREGMAGLSVFLGADAPTERAVVQVAGHALVMSAGDFLAAVAALDGPLTHQLRRYAQAMFTQLARNAACNRIHSTRQRAARWLLTTSDRMERDQFPLTQEFLAQMLAVRRATVNQVARALADDCCITYTRGTITVLDRDGLHSVACDCYDIVRAAYAPAGSR